MRKLGLTLFWSKNIEKCGTLSEINFFLISHFRYKVSGKVGMVSKKLIKIYGEVTRVFIEVIKIHILIFQL